MRTYTCAGMRQLFPAFYIKEMKGSKMNRRELIRRIAFAMRENNIRKPVSSPKQVFHISDDNGNHKDFIVKQTDKTVIFTENDIEAVVDTLLEVIKDTLRRGDEISIRGFGTLGLKYRKSRATKKPGTDEWVDVEARYVPKFSFGNDLRMCAKVYELSLNDQLYHAPLPIFDEDEDGGGG